MFTKIIKTNRTRYVKGVCPYSDVEIINLTQVTGAGGKDSCTRCTRSQQIVTTCVHHPSHLSSHLFSCERHLVTWWHIPLTGLLEKTATSSTTMIPEFLAVSTWERTPVTWPRWPLHGLWPLWHTCWFDMSALDCGHGQWCATLVQLTIAYLER